MAAVAIRTGGAGENHSTNFSLVAWVPDDGTELGDAMCELAEIAVGTRALLLPLVA